MINISITIFDKILCRHYNGANLMTIHYSSYCPFCNTEAFSSLFFFLLEQTEQTRTGLSYICWYIIVAFSIDRLI